MKYIFFINPAAGQGRGIPQFEGNVEKTAMDLGLWDDTEIYRTKCLGDAEKVARQKAEELKDEECRFYACGGDGTFNEILNGVVGFDHVSVGVVPLGTGNDMVRNFPEAGDFLNLTGQMKGISRKIDLIQYSGKINGTDKVGYCANMFNIGFDCNVVEMAGRLKKRPLIAGSAAYMMAILGMFIQKKGIKLKLIEDGKVLVDGELLLCSIANGSYCGGGVYSSPQSSLNDGMFDLNMIRDVTRTQFLKLFPSYQKGTHLDKPGVEKIIRVKKCTKLTLVPKDKNFFLCVDGEISIAETVDFEIAPAALNFIVPIREMEH